MLVTATGPIVYAVVLIISTSLLSLTIGNRSSLITIMGLVLAFLAWIYVFKRGFETGWIRGIGIALLALFTHLFVAAVPPIITTKPFQLL